MGSLALWERIAGGTIARADVSTPVDSIEVARGNDLLILPMYDGTADVDDQGVLRFNDRLEDRTKQAVIARALAHWELKQQCMRATPATIAYLTRALQLPRDQFYEESSACEWNFDELMTQQPNAHAENLVGRLHDAHGALVTFYMGDKQVLKRMIPNHLSQRLAQPTPLESQLVREAFQQRRTVQAETRVYAVPLNERLTATVCEPAQLGFKFR